MRENARIILLDFPGFPGLIWTLTLLQSSCIIISLTAIILHLRVRTNLSLPSSQLKQSLSVNTTKNLLPGLDPGTRLCVCFTLKIWSSLTFTIGVMNSSKNGKRVKVGQLLWIKLMRSPLMCEPSWSWSVMIMTWPYLKLLRSSSEAYFLLYCRPRILIKLLISAFSRIWNDTVSQLSWQVFFWCYSFEYTAMYILCWFRKNGILRIPIPRRKLKILWPLFPQNNQTPNFLSEGFFSFFCLATKPSQEWFPLLQFMMP